MVDIIGLTDRIFLYGPQPYPIESDKPTDTNNVRKRAPRYKTRYTPSQIQHLERCYLKSRWLNSNRKKEIAEQTGLQRCQVQSWFQNRRRKEKIIRNHLASSHTRDPDEPSTPEGSTDDPLVLGTVGRWDTSPNPSSSTLPTTSSRSAEHNCGLQVNSCSDQSPSSSYRLDGEKLLYSNKSFSPPSSYSSVDPLLEVGVEQTTTPNHNSRKPQTSQYSPNSAIYCELCNRTFSRHQDLERHQKTDPAHSKDTQIEIWECLYCGGGFRSKRADAWKRHMADKHRAEVCLLRVLPNGKMVEWNRKKTLLAIGSKPPFEHDTEYNGRHFRVKQY